MIFPILLIITLVVVLGIWTSHIYENRRKEELRSALESVISERGEKGLFDLAGIPSESMNYGPVDLYLEERGAWTFQDNELSDIAVYDKAKVSTVQIIGSTSLRDESQASGVIISSDGYIVTNKHVLSSGESIILKYNLMYDSCSRLPETDSVFRCYTFQKIIYFLIGSLCYRQIYRSAFIRLYQMVAMYSCWYSRNTLSGIHELK